MKVHLGQNNYGKSRVRLVKVTRHADRHDLMEVSVDTALEGDYETAHTVGDNSKVLPTDTQKNTVYALAKKHSFDSIEDFGEILAKHFVDGFPQFVRSARIDLAQTIWSRLSVDGAKHPHSFVGGNNERRVATVEQSAKGTSFTAGLKDLLVLKTTESSFEGYPKDQYTTLPETKDRIFATSVTARWKYAKPPADFNKAHAAMRDALIRVFATRFSPSVQETMYYMGEAALAACPEASEVRLSLPNKHCLLIDLQRFGMDNPNEIFVPTDEPHGFIEATIVRD